MLIFILSQFLILFIVSTLFGARINQYFKLNLHPNLNLVLGFIVILALIYILSMIWVLLRLSTFYFYIVLSILISLCIITSILNIKKYTFSNYKFYVLGLIILIMLMILTFRYSYGIRSFDGAVYLSSILDNINAPFLNAYNPYDGQLVTQINVENDYQSFYYLNSYFLWMFTQIQLFLKQDFYPSLSSVYLVSMTAFYFTFLYHLVLGTIQSLRIKSKTIILFILIYVFGYFTSAYFNSSLAFLGQAYRTLIIGFMSLIVYINLNHHLIDKSSILLLSLSAVAAISTSSSAYFIVFIILYAWLFIKIKDTNNLDYIQYCLIASFPIVLFVLLYIFSNMNFIIGLLGLMCIVFYVLYRNPKTLINLKVVVQYIIPISITFVSMGLILFKGSSITHIFTQASAYDMVFDYFSFYSINQIIINLLLWSSIIILMIKGDRALRNYYLILFIVFINPLNFVFMYELFAGRVVHRVFDVLFNPVSVIILFSIALPLIHKRIRIIFIGILIVLCIHAQTEIYHFVFIRPNNSSYIERITQHEIDVLNVLNTKIQLEKLERPKVISQIHFVKAYVKDITLPLSYRIYRSLDVYEKEIAAPSALWNIFVYRDFESMRIFDTDPDYINTCQYLIEEQVNFVLVARNQFYRENNEYIPLYFRVRDCASLVYENDDYLLYQFYW